MLNCFAANARVAIPNWMPSEIVLAMNLHKSVQTQNHKHTSCFDGSSVKITGDLQAEHNSQPTR